MKDYILVGGLFNKEGGKTSKIISRMSKIILSNSKSLHVINGGFFDDLKLIEFSSYKNIIWMPDIRNDEDKLIGRIKKKAPKSLLISSKQMRDTYEDSDLVGRLLQAKSNLGIAIRFKSQRYCFKLIDPLGNIYTETRDIDKLTAELIKRIDFLQESVRIKSTCIGSTVNHPIIVAEEYLSVIRDYGKRFTEFVKAVNPNRFLGNAATRCSYGFPAMRKGDTYLVSKRNINKENITKDSFVPVFNNEDEVLYLGDSKPSVDTPIDILLLNHYHNINLIIHGHAYIDNAEFTTVKYPCGDVREFEGIKEIYQNKSERNFCVNLKGHGCLILAKDLSYFDKISLIARPFLED